MNKRPLRFGRLLLIVVGSVLLTSFTIDATDTFRTSQTALGLLASKVTAVSCPTGMVEVFGLERRLCVDVYEAGVGESCVIASPKSAQETAANAADADCEPVSVAEEVPWTFVAQSQAAVLCAKAQKRLPSAKEWYIAALGTADGVETCNLAGQLADTGAWPGCRSGAGAFDMVGNVWELVEGRVEDSNFLGKTIPLEGYVAGVDEAGVAYQTEGEPNVVFNGDYFWSSNYGQFVLMRGGFYGSRNDGGVYAIHAKTEPTFASGAVGFRCVKDL